MAPRYYPMFVSLQDRVCLVVGGGNVGERKIRKLLRYGGHVHLVARALTPWLQRQLGTEQFRHLGSNYRESLLEDVDLVFAATNDTQLNRTIADHAATRGLWCNMATDPERGSFFVPASFEQGPLTIAISTSGLSPAVAAGVRRRMEQQFQGPWTLYLTLLGELRTAIQGKAAEAADHQELFRTLAALPLLEWIEHDQAPRARQAIGEACVPWLSMREIEQIWDRAWKSSF